jgi:hypothetical protein
MEIQKEYNLRSLLAKVRIHEEKRRTGSNSGRTNATYTMSDVFRHRSRTGKSYCRTRSDVRLERVNFLPHLFNPPREGISGTHRIGGWLGPKPSLNVVEMTL